MKIYVPVHRTTDGPGGHLEITRPIEGMAFVSREAAQAFLEAFPNPHPPAYGLAEEVIELTLMGESGYCGKTGECDNTRTVDLLAESKSTGPSCGSCGECEYCCYGQA